MDEDGEGSEDDSGDGGFGGGGFGGGRLFVTEAREHLVMSMDYQGNNVTILHKVKDTFPLVLLN